MVNGACELWQVIDGLFAGQFKGTFYKKIVNETVKVKFLVIRYSGNRLIRTPEGHAEVSVLSGYPY